MKVVFDTNVLVSGILFGGPPRQLLQLTARGVITAYTSAELFAELEAVLRRRKFGLAPAQISQILHVVSESFEIVVPSTRLNVIKVDPDDNRVLEAAIAAQAQVIVSGDSDLLELGSYKGVPILTPSSLVMHLTG